MLSLGLAVVGASAQSQNQTSSQTSGQTSKQGSQVNSSGSSLGDYARQIRKNSAPSAKPKVFDNDNLPTEDKLSVVGAAPTSAPTEEAKADDSANGDSKAGSETKPADDKTAGTEQKTDQKTATPKSPEEEEAAKQAAWKQWGERLAAQKDQIDLATRELDVVQREYQLRAAAMYGDAGNRLRNQAQWDVEDAKYKQQIADKQKAVEDAKQKLDDMQEEARKAGVPANIREP